MKCYKQSMENMTRTLIDQFSELVKGHVDDIVPVSQGIDLRVGPTTPEGCLLGDFEFSYPLSSKSLADTLLCDFKVKNDIFTRFCTCFSP